MQLDIALGNTVFVIPSSNGGESLARMLPTLAIPTRLIVVLDQGSTDNTARVCKEAGVEFVPLGQPCSYAQACNVGAGLARERSAEFIYVARNDIAFATDVARQLLQEMLDDPGLAIAAPSQALIEKKGGAPRVAYRAFWSLDRLRFEYDFTPPPESRLIFVT